MGKLIFFIVIATLLGTIAWLVKGNDDKPNFALEVKRLKLKILQEKARVQEGIEGAAELVRKYTNELADIEELNSKINK